MKFKHIFLVLLFSFGLSACQTTETYTVTWKNYDGTVLETDRDMTSGMIPTYDGDTPTRDSSDQYTYTFSGWSTEIVAVTSDIIFTAQYSSVVNTYDVTWENHDGTTLEIDEDVPYGTTPSYNGTTPSKESSAQYTYTFSGWSPEVVSVTGNTTYTAQFSSVVNTYSVTWKNHDGTTLELDEDVPHGSTPSFNGSTPSKVGSAQYSYTFSGWSPEVVSVTGNATYTAQFDDSVNAYSVTWKNHDGTTLEADEDVPYGSTPSYNGATPSKEGSAQYSYTFSGWSPEVVSVTGNATYTAQYDYSVNTYSVTWKNYDGTTLEVDEDVPYGSTPSYNGATPSKEGNAQYTYAFSGWTTEIGFVTGDTIYTAQFEHSVNAYFVTWIDYDGTTLEVDVDVPYGSTPSYDGATPSKEGSAQYTYTFNGWSPGVTSVTGDAIYTAQFSYVVNSYDITWNNYDGTTLDYDEDIMYGAIPSYSAPTPTRDSSAQYTYTFSGWSPEVSLVTGDATYTAQFSYVENSYLVTWENHDGTALEYDEDVPYGTTPTYDGETPTRVSNEQYTYTFSGWSQLVGPVTGNVTYTAEYSYVVNSYDVTWKNYDGTILKFDNLEYGSTPSFDEATPTRDSSDQYTYTFSGWSPEVSSITGDVIYTAQYMDIVNSYNVTWKNYDGTTLQVDTVDYGTMPSYDGTIPTKEDDGDGPYQFAGWSPSETIVEGNQTYIAEYVNIYLKFTLNSENNTYSVTRQEDGTPISVEIPSTYLGKPVTSIGGNAFSNCTSLTSIVIPDSVTKIGYLAFSGCTSLTSVVIPDSITSIGINAFYQCSSLTSIVIPYGVTRIEDSSFQHCTSLTSVVIPDTVTSIGGNAFLNCTSLESINIPNGVTSIGSYVFFDCQSLTSIIMPEGVTSIGSYAFADCISLSSIVIPDSVTSIGEGAFSGMNALTSIIIPDNVTSIDGYLFSYCSSLTSVVIPEGVTSIDERAFNYCTSLESIDIPNSVTSIGDSAFFNCVSLASAEISTGVTSIGNSSFFNCISLTTIVIPDSVTYIGSEAFNICTSLTIYAEASSKPSGWDEDWNIYNRPVVWSYVA